MAHSRLVLSAWCALSAIACGDVGLHAIVRLEPIDSWQSDCESTQINYSVDVVPTYCAEIDSGMITKCSLEPFGSHLGRVVFENQAEMNPDNPLEGQEVVTGWRLQFTSDNANAPALRPLSGRLRQVIPPAGLVSFNVPLVDIATKSEFLDGRPETAIRYTALLIVDTENGQRLRTSTFIELGPFNNCPEETFPVASCL